MSKQVSHKELAALVSTLLTNPEYGGDIPADDWRRQLSVGGEVYWQDPDAGIASGFYSINRINGDSGEVRDESTVLLLNNAAGSEVEVLASELRAKKPETLKLRLVVDVEVNLNEEDRNDFLVGFSNRVERAIANGMLTGDTSADVEEHSTEVVLIGQGPQQAPHELAGLVFEPDIEKDLEMQHGYEHPAWPRAEWQQDASSGDTKLGYWLWVAHQLESGVSLDADDEARQERANSLNRDIFREALRAKSLSTSLSAKEDIRLRRDLVAQEVLGRYPIETVITRELYDSDPDFGDSLNWMHRHFEFPSWEGRTVSDFQIKHCITGEPVCMNVVQYSIPVPNKDGMCAGNITLQCVFRRSWTAIPSQAGHAFRSKLDSRSVATRGFRVLLC